MEIVIQQYTIYDFGLEITAVHYVVQCVWNNNTAMHYLLQCARNNNIAMQYLLQCLENNNTEEPLVREDGSFQPTFSVTLPSMFPCQRRTPCRWPLVFGRPPGLIFRVVLKDWFDSNGTRPDLFTPLPSRRLTLCYGSLTTWVLRCVTADWLTVSRLTDYVCFTLCHHWLTTCVLRCVTADWLRVFYTLSPLTDCVYFTPCHHWLRVFYTVSPLTD